MPTSTATTTADTASGLIISLVVLGVLCLYFLPSIIAIKRGVNLAYVLCVNLFFGWTFIGWLSAFISACATKIYIDNRPMQIFLPTSVPGWYPDPQGQGRRYWDGAQWTEHVAN